MARPTSPTPTDAERVILDVLWERGEASVREVTYALSATRKVAYTTVLTMLKVLERKGYVKHRSEGRAFVYRAAVSRSEARRSALRRLLAQFFDGSPEALAQHLLREHEVDLDELDTLQREVDRARNGERS